MGMTTATASRLIARHGRAVTFLRQGAPVSDGGGGSTPGPVTPHTATGFVASFDDELKGQGGGFVQADDVKLLVAVDGLTITPTPGDRVQVGDDMVNVIRVSRVDPDGDLRFWIVQGRAQ